MLLGSTQSFIFKVGKSEGLLHISATVVYFQDHCRQGEMLALHFTGAPKSVQTISVCVFVHVPRLTVYCIVLYTHTVLHISICACVCACMCVYLSTAHVQLNTRVRVLQFAPQCVFVCFVFQALCYFSIEFSLPCISNCCGLKRDRCS